MPINFDDIPITNATDEGGVSVSGPYDDIPMEGENWTSPNNSAYNWLNQEDALSPQEDLEQSRLFQGLPANDTTKDQSFLSNATDLAAESVDQAKANYAALLATGAWDRLDEESRSQLANTIANAARPYDRPEELNQYFETVGKEATDVGDAWKKGNYGDAALEGLDFLGETLYEGITNPKGFAYATTEQAANLVGTLLPGAAGAQGGGLIGSVAGPAGTAVGSTVGFFAGSMTGSYLLETGAQIREFITKNGGNPEDPQQILNALNNPEVRSDMLTRASAKGLSIAAWDAAANVLGIKLLKNVKGPVSAATRGTGAMTAQVGGAAAGEIMGQQLATGEVNPEEVGAEVALEMGPGGFADIATSTYAARNRAPVDAPIHDAQNAEPEDVIAAEQALTQELDVVDSNDELDAALRGIAPEQSEPVAEVAPDVVDSGALSEEIQTQRAAETLVETPVESEPVDSGVMAEEIQAQRATETLQEVVDETPIPEAPIINTAVPTISELNSMKVAELRKLAGSLGIKPFGSKADLLNRLGDARVSVAANEPNFADVRLSYDVYRNDLTDFLKKSWVPDGGIELLPAEGAKKTSDTGDMAYDYGNDLRYSSSVNPDWVQSLVQTSSRKEVLEIIDRATQGDTTLTDRQMSILTTVLDEFDGGVPGQFIPQTTATMEDMATVAAEAPLPVDIFGEATEEDFAVDFDEFINNAQSLSDLDATARNMGLGDEAADIMQSSIPDTAVAQRLYDLIQGGVNEQTRQTTQPSGYGQDRNEVPAIEGQGVEGDGGFNGQPGQTDVRPTPLATQSDQAETNEVAASDTQYREPEQLSPAKARFLQEFTSLSKTAIRDELKSFGLPRRLNEDKLDSVRRLGDAYDAVKALNKFDSVKGVEQAIKNGQLDKNDIWRYAQAVSPRNRLPGLSEINSGLNVLLLRDFGIRSGAFELKLDDTAKETEQTTILDDLISDYEPSKSVETPTTDVWELFSPEAQRNADAGVNSRSFVVEYPIDSFLNLVSKGKNEPDKAQELLDFEQLDNYPKLIIQVAETGFALVRGHEGRHRARELKRRGYKTMPVAFIHEDRGNPMRWSEQTDKQSSNYRKVFPFAILGEYGSDAARNEDSPRPFPIKRGQYGVIKESPILESYTEEDLADRQAQQDQAVADENAAERKAIADAEVDNFSLTGSDLPADANPAQTDLVEQSRSFDDDSPQFQRSEKKTELSALHNLSADNLIYADKMGGLAVPSIAIAKGDMAHTGYGEITLIGTKALGDPAQTEVYDSDAWSTRHPKPEYNNAKPSKAQALFDEVNPWVKKYSQGYSYAADAIFEEGVNNPSPERMADAWFNNDGIKALFIKETTGRDVRVPTTAAPQNYTESSDPEIVAFIKDLPENYEDLGASSDVQTNARRGLAPLLEKAIREKYANRPELADRLVDTAIDNGEVVYTAFERIKNDVARQGETVIDGALLGERLRKQLKGKEAQYQQWMNDKILSIFGEPFVRVRGKKLPYTLENIVAAMTVTSTQSQEKSLAFGEGKARAAAATKFTDLEWMRNAAESGIVSEENLEQAQKETKRLTQEYRDSVIDYYQNLNWRGEVDTWSALDDSMKALSDWLAGSKRGGDVSSFRAALRKNDFANVPNDVIAKGVKAANALKYAPVAYFEAKPTRSVMLNEFAGAVVPSNVSQDVLDILEKNNIPVRKYNRRADPDVRTKAVINFRKQLARQGKDVLFDRATDTPAFAGVSLDVANSIAERFAGKPITANSRIVIKARESELPTEILREAEQQGARGHIQGVSWNGSIYIVANNMRDAANVEETLLHESTHDGGKKLFGNERGAAYQKLWLKMGGEKGLRQLIVDNGLTDKMQPYFNAADNYVADGTMTSGQRRSYLIDEFLAYSQGQKAYATFPQKIKTAIQEFFGYMRDALRQTGFVELAKYNDADLAYLLKKLQLAYRNTESQEVQILSSQFMRGNQSGEEQFTQDVLAELAANDEFFRYPESKGTKIQDVMGDVFPRATYIGDATMEDERSESGADRRYQFTTGNWEDFYVLEKDTGEVWVDVSRLEEGSGGSGIYAAVANYVYNVGGTFVGDPMGLSQAAIVRRTSNMLSSALKYGTTSHIAPATEQRKGVPEKGIVPLEWSGTDADKTMSLIRTFVETLYNQVPSLNDYRYDFRNSSYVTRDGQKVESLWRTIPSDDARAGRAGEATLRRGVFLKSLMESESGERPGFLENVFTRSNSLTREPELKAMFMFDFGKKSNNQDTSNTTTVFLGKDANGNDIKLQSNHPSLKDQNALKLFAKRWFYKEGLLGDEGFARNIEQMGIKNSDEIDISFLGSSLKSAAKKGFKKRYNGLTDVQKKRINDALAGEKVMLPQEVADAVKVLRTSLDGMSGKVQQVMLDEMRYRLEKLPKKEQQEALSAIAKVVRGTDVDDIEWGKVDSFIAAKARAYLTIQENKGQYLNRSYEVFDDPKWEKKIRKNLKVMDDVRLYLNQRIDPDNKLPSNEVNDQVEGIINKILRAGQESGSMMAFMSSSQLGEKDLSILRQRKEIAPEIRALMGEYQDAYINYVRSMSKMSYLVANHHFLKSVRQDGLGKFLSTKPSGRMSAQITAVDRNEMSPLVGLYATPEMNQALTDAVKTTDYAGWLRWMLGVNSAVKFGKTVLSPTTSARNFYSAFMFAFANGHFNYGHALTALKSTLADMGVGRNDNRRAYLTKLAKMGVLHDNPYASELKAALNDVADMDTTKGSAPVRAGKGVLNIATSIYRAGDDFHKIVGFENEKSALMKSGLSEKAAEERAAQRIRDGYPTYSMVPRAIRELRKFPLVGTFVSFPWEMIRTSKNMFGFIKEDMREGRKAEAARRVVGMTLAASAAQTLSYLSLTMMGLDGDDDEAIRQIAPDWQRNAQLLYLGYDDKGMPVYLDMSHLDPYTYLKAPVTALLNGNNDTAQKKLDDAFVQFFEPFLGVDISAKAVTQVFTNQNDFGGKIYNDYDPWHVKAATGLGYLFGVYPITDKTGKLMPGALTNLERTIKAAIGEKTAAGRVFNTKDELLSWVGFRFTTMDMSTSLKFRAMQYKDGKAQSGRELRGVLTNPNTGRSDRVAKAYEQSRKSFEGNWKSMQAAVNAAKALGLDKKGIGEALLSANVSKNDIGYLLSDKMPKYVPGKQSLTNMRKQLLQGTKDRGVMFREWTERMRALKAAMDN